MTDDSVDGSGHAGRAALQTLFEQATAGLNPGEREAIELQLRQGLDVSEVADVLGVSRNHAESLLSRARGRLEKCLAVLLVGRAGRDDCGELDSMLTGWDGQLTALLRKRVHRHIEHCATCTARRAVELRPAMLLDLSPGAVLAAGAACSLKLAASAPTALKRRTLTLTAGRGPVAAQHSAAVLARAGSFSKKGFPKPVRAGKAGLVGQHRAGDGTALRLVLAWGRVFLRLARFCPAIPFTRQESSAAPVTPPRGPTATPLVGPAPGSTPATAPAPGPRLYNDLLITSYP
ncbi:MAG TPA: sigma-70 family RNA polymerase sigma factor [Trebonia sp.]|nr:sigma-70 family RNA polymerase sigma factor [Trebonia sp.]